MRLNIVEDLLEMVVIGFVDLGSCGVPGYQTQMPTGYGLTQPRTDTRGRSPSPAPPTRYGHPHPYNPNMIYAPGVGSDPETDDPDKDEAGF